MKSIIIKALTTNDCTYIHVTEGAISLDRMADMILSLPQSRFSEIALAIYDNKPEVFNTEIALNLNVTMGKLNG